jgi:cell division protein FtsL
MVIQRILRHANVSTTATYYIKTAAADVRKAMTILENHIEEAGQIQSDAEKTMNGNSNAEPSTIQ